MVSNTIELDMCIFPKVDLVKEKRLFLDSFVKAGESDSVFFVFFPVGTLSCCLPCCTTTTPLN